MANTTPTSDTESSDAHRIDSDATVTVAVSPPGETVVAAAPGTKQAACLSCRSIKIKCVRSSSQAKTCNRCLNKGLKCTIPDYRVGRRKGVPNKRRGLDKAIHQLQQALNDAKTVSEGPDSESALRLQQLLGEAGAVVSNLHNHSNEQNRWKRSTPRSASTVQTPSSTIPASLAGSTLVRQEDTLLEPLVVEDTENPLQLLAHATEQCVPLPLSSGQPHAPLGPHQSRSHAREDGADDVLLRSFFGPPRVNLDVAPSLDPINLGYVTAVEAEDLVIYFHGNLSHTRWGLDPAIHTAHFIRQRSAFLFTTVMAAAAKFIPTAAALSTRLSAHCKTLANHVMNNRNRSVEIVIAFMFSVPWLPAGEHWEDDEGSSLLANALAVALDLSLDKVIVSSSSKQHSRNDGLAGRDVVDARKALALDGFHSIEPTSNLGGRLLRRRERVWLALFILDRGFCMARERRSLFPMDTPLLERCDDWHISDLAAPADSSLISIAVLRRDLIGLIANVKARCDKYQPGVEDGTVVAESIRDTIETFLSNWFSTWAPIVADRKNNNTLPPYVEILSCHTRLSIYGLVMNHPTAPVQVHRFFRVGGLSASINVMRSAVQGESLWKSVPNNTVIMIAFAACLALRLSHNTPTPPPVPDSSSSLGGAAMQSVTNHSNIANSVRDLVLQTADVFERIGSSPAHRKGASVLYAMHLRRTVRKYQHHHFQQQHHHHHHHSQESARTTDAMANIKSVAESPPVTQQQRVNSSSGNQETGGLWQDGNSIVLPNNYPRDQQQRQQQQHHHHQHQHHRQYQPTEATSMAAPFAEMSDVEFSAALKNVENELFSAEALVSGFAMDEGGGGGVGMDGDSTMFSSFVAADWWSNLDWLTWNDDVVDGDDVGDGGVGAF